MSEISVKTIKKLFALSGNKCAFPYCKNQIINDEGSVIGEICHIEAKNSNGARFNSSQSDKDRQACDNLILLCPTHHKTIDSDPNLYTTEVLKQIKSEHEQRNRRVEKSEDSIFAKLLLNKHNANNTIVHNSGNIAINSPGVIQGEKVTVKTTTKKTVLASPPGSIGDNINQTKYISHLIERYNYYASNDPKYKNNPNEKFKFGAIYGNLHKTFGANWKLLSSEKFDDVVEYLQKRILRTRLAKINKSKGYAAFSDYEEYLEKYK